MRGVDWLYVSICLDVLPAAVAPGVSAPAGFGMPLAVLESLLKYLKQSGKVRYTDIVELNPKFDIDQRTAKVAARLVWVCQDLRKAIVLVTNLHSSFRNTLRIYYSNIINSS